MKRKFHVPFLEEGEGAISSSYSATSLSVSKTRKKPGFLELH